MERFPSNQSAFGDFLAAEGPIDLAALIRATMAKRGFTNKEQRAFLKGQGVGDRADLSSLPENTLKRILEEAKVVVDPMKRKKEEKRCRS